MLADTGMLKESFECVRDALPERLKIYFRDIQAINGNTTIRDLGKP